MPLLSVPFTNNRQQKPFWCWAAVAANVYNSMRPATVPSQSQCDVVTLVEKNCAGDEPDALASALADLGINFQLTVRPQIAVVEDQFDSVSTQLDKANENGVPVPVCAEIMFPGPAFHFAAISAVDTDTQHVWVSDPYLGGDSVEFSYPDFVNAYNYASKPAPGPGIVQNFQKVLNNWKVSSNKVNSNLEG
jgi:hypothetical protein